LKPFVANLVAISAASAALAARRTALSEGSIERRALQCVVGVLAAIPVLVGAEGVISGPEFLHVSEPWPADLDSHFRFLSGIFLAMGVGWYSCIPAIEANMARVRLLAALTFAGGLARLFSLILGPIPSSGHLGGIGMELVVVPLLVLWQARIARQHRANAMFAA
jgi:hypothetical protein